jgi:dolichol kinase
MWFEIRRKAFHLLSLIYVLGLIYIPRTTYLLLLMLGVVVVYGFEYGRIHSTLFGVQVDRYFGGLYRDHEKSKLSGLFWMLLGVVITVSLVKSVPLAVTALLYLILGDGVASLIGLRFRGPHWPGLQKRLSGSLACFVICLLIGQVILRPEYGWHGILAGAATATIVEMGFIPLDDNVTIPVASSVVLMMCYGLIPGL